MCFRQDRLNSKKRDFLQGKCYFFKVDDFCSAVEIEEKHEKNDKKRFKINVCFHTLFFKDFGANLGGFWLPS